MSRRNPNLAHASVSRVYENIVFLGNYDGRNGEPQKRSVVDPHITEFRLPFRRRILLPVFRRKLRRVRVRAGVVRNFDFQGDEVGRRE